MQIINFVIGRIYGSFDGIFPFLFQKLIQMACNILLDSKSIMSSNVEQSLCNSIENYFTR